MQIPLLDLKAQYATIRDEIRAAVDEVLESQHFILGPTVEKLENEVAQYCNTEYAIGVASGTDALALSLMAIDVGPGDEVITTPYTFFATAGSISRLGATPTFVDINPKTYNIDPNLIEEKITDKTRAIIPVHLYGQCVDMNPILEIAQKYNLKVIEDAAQAIGAEHNKHRAASMGDLGCLSFFPSKNLGGYGDGGMVVTNNEELAERVKVLRVHGSKPKYFHRVIGCNSRLDTIQAAVLRVKFKYLDDWNQKRRENAQRYDRLLEGTQVIPPYVEPHNAHIYNQYTIRVEHRDAIEKHLKSRGIGCALYYPLPLHLQECYEHLGYREGDFPESEKAARQTISIPIYPELTEVQQRYVVENLA